jgi:SHS2 domain-containing protein
MCLISILRSTKMARACKYRFLEHPADIKIQTYGYDLPKTFINAASSMMEYIYGKNKIKVEYTEKIEVVAESLESLLVNWLAKILALSSINRRAYVAFNIVELKAPKLLLKSVQEKLKRIMRLKQ